MLQNKYLILLLTPALIFSLLGLLSHETDVPVVRQSVVQAQPSPIILPQPISLAKLETLSETKPESVSEPVIQPNPAPAPKPKTSTNRITTSTTAKPAPAPACSGSFSQEFLCLLNQYRASQGKARLSSSSSLAAVALSHSTWMNSTGSFSHTGIDGSRLGDRCRSAGITCRAENLALGATSPQNLLNLWKSSSGHNANLLGAYSTFGLGISGSYITALFN